MDIEKEVLRTVEKYKLFEKRERVGVAVSGGKDSVVLLYILKKLGFDVVALMLDLEIGEWTKVHVSNVSKFCLELGIELKVFDFREYFDDEFGEVLARIAKDKGISRCSVCGVAKKWGLNYFAKKIGLDVLATGHNADDESQNVLMNFLKGNVEIGSGFGPVSGSRSDLGFVKRVKPFFFVPESEILKYSRKMKFDILYDKCPNAVGTYRIELREWMEGNVSDEEKVGIVEGFMDKISELEFERKDVGFCERCGEVCRGEVCGFCELVSNI